MDHINGPNIYSSSIYPLLCISEVPFPLTWGSAMWLAKETVGNLTIQRLEKCLRILVLCSSAVAMRLCLS